MRRRGIIVYDFMRYRVEEAMSRDPMTIREDATLGDAEAIFEAHDFNGLPVVDDDGLLIGLLTKLDVLGAFRFTEDSIFPAYEVLMRKPVSEFMRTDVSTVKPRTLLTKVLERIVRTRYKSLVVEEDGRPVGIISREDVMAALRRAVEHEREELGADRSASDAGA